MKYIIEVQQGIYIERFNNSGFSTTTIKKHAKRFDFKDNAEKVLLKLKKTLFLSKFAIVVEY